MRSVVAQYYTLAPDGQVYGSYRYPDPSQFPQGRGSYRQPIAFAYLRDESQIVLGRRRAQSEPDVRAARGDSRRDRGMREFLVCVANDARAIDSIIFEQAIDQQSRPRAALPVDEAKLSVGDVAKGF